MGSLESPFLGDGWWSQKKQYIGGNCLKMGAWTVYRFKGGDLAKKRVMHLM